MYSGNGIQHLLLAVVTCVTAGSCSGSPALSPSSSGEAVTATASPTPTVWLPAASVFGPASWGVQLPQASRQKAPVVTAQRVIVLDGSQVRAIDSKGATAWNAAWEGFTDETRTGGELPVLRLVSPDVVAVVDSGQAQGQGLDEDGYVARVTLLRVQDGSLVKSVAISGTATQAPTLGPVGLGFVVDGTSPSAVGVLSDGQVQTAPSAAEKRVAAAATVGSTVLTLSGTSSDAVEGVTAAGWDSRTVAPTPAATLASLEASDADHLALLRFSVPNGGSAQRVLDVRTGKVVASPNCESHGIRSVTASPSRAWQVIGPMRLDREGNTQCIGGEGQKRVTLTAVTDDGRAFGRADQGGGESVFVDLAPNGEVTTSTLPARAEPPIGVMQGDLAIHWDPNSAVLTANPITK